MRLTVLGCAGSGPGPTSPASSYLITAGDTRLLLDLGNTRLKATRAERARAPFAHAHAAADFDAALAQWLVRHAPPAVADAFCATRLGGDWGHAFGTLPHRLDTAAIVDRARVGRA